MAGTYHRGGSGSWSSLATTTAVVSRPTTSPRAASPFKIFVRAAGQPAVQPSPLTSPRSRPISGSWRGGGKYGGTRRESRAGWLQTYKHDLETRRGDTYYMLGAGCSLLPLVSSPSLCCLLRRVPAVQCAKDVTRGDADTRPTRAMWV